PARCVRRASRGTPPTASSRWRSRVWCCGGGWRRGASRPPLPWRLGRRASQRRRRRGWHPAGAGSGHRSSFALRPVLAGALKEDFQAHERVRGVRLRIAAVPLLAVLPDRDGLVVLNPKRLGRKVVQILGGPLHVVVAAHGVDLLGAPAD